MTLIHLPEMSESHVDELFDALERRGWRRLRGVDVIAPRGTFFLRRVGRRVGDVRYFYRRMISRYERINNDLNYGCEREDAAADTLSLVDTLNETRF